MKAKKIVGWLILLMVLSGAIASAVMAAGWTDFIKFLGVLLAAIIITLLVIFAINLIEDN